MTDFDLDPLLPPPLVDHDAITETDLVVAVLERTDPPHKACIEDARNLWARLVEQIGSSDSEAEILVTIHSYIVNAERRGEIRGGANHEIRDHQTEYSTIKGRDG